MIMSNLRPKTPAFHCRISPNNVLCGAPKRSAEYPEGWTSMQTSSGPGGIVSCPECEAEIARRRKHQTHVTNPVASALGVELFTGTTDGTTDPPLSNLEAAQRCLEQANDCATLEEGADYAAMASACALVDIAEGLPTILDALTAMQATMEAIARHTGTDA